MNKKLIISLATIAAVAAIAVGGTIAYFSDTETSTGNTFTAGTLDLLIDSDCEYNGMECTNGYWDNNQVQGNECSCNFGEKDLAGELFFDFEDIKPGDEGEDTISLHVEDNDAWVCATLGPLVNHDNGCNEPEDIVDDTCGNPGTKTSGELGDNLYFNIWADTCNVSVTPCDNVYQDGCDIPLTSGPANGDPLSGVTWAIADSVTGSNQPLPGDTTFCLGVGWNVSSSVGNIIQSDSVTGDISFYAVQSRNNSGFTCGTCGNGVLEAGEGCETDADCTFKPGGTCSHVVPTECQCVYPIQGPPEP